MCVIAIIGFALFGHVRASLSMPRVSPTSHDTDTLTDMHSCRPERHKQYDHGRRRCLPCPGLLLILLHCHNTHHTLECTNLH
jgi:hypothetical protein